MFLDVLELVDAIHHHACDTLWRLGSLLLPADSKSWCWQRTETCDPTDHGVVYSLFGIWEEIDILREDEDHRGMVK